MNHFCLFAFVLLIGFTQAREPLAGVRLCEDDEIDWDQFGKNGLSFAILDASSGQMQNSYMEKWNQLLKLNITPGALHLYDSRISPYHNFETVDIHIFRNVNFTKEHLFALDLYNEGNLNPQEFTEDIHTFLDLVEGMHHIRPIIYANPHFYAEHIDQEASHKYRFETYRLWTWQAHCFRPTLYGNWNDYFIWEFDLYKLIGTNQPVRFLWLKSSTLTVD